METSAPLQRAARVAALGASLVIAGLVVLYVWEDSLSTELLLSKGARTTQGRLESNEHHNSSRGMSGNWYVTYSVDGKDYRGAYTGVAPPNPDPSTLYPGAPMTVFYLEGNPKRSTLGEPNVLARQSLLRCGGLVALVVAIGFFAGRRRWRSE